MARPWPVAALFLLLNPVAPAADPALDYMLQCQGCHLEDGTGGGDIPSLRGVGGLLARPGGREYLARVPGVANASVDDARLAALLSWVLLRWSASELPADFAPYRAEELAAWRRPWPDPRRARRALVGPDRARDDEAAGSGRAAESAPDARQGEPDRPFTAPTAAD